MLHTPLKAGWGHVVAAASLLRTAAIMACADTRRRNATSSMAGLLPAPRVGAMAEGLDAVEDDAPGEARTALEAAAVAVVDIHLPILQAFLTL